MALACSRQLEQPYQGHAVSLFSPSEKHFFSMESPIFARILEDEASTKN
jgi:hypothetical protein